MILDPTKIARYVNKANIVTAAWRALFGAVPTKHSVILAMSVGQVLGTLSFAAFLLVVVYDIRSGRRPMAK